MYVLKIHGWLPRDILFFAIKNYVNTVVIIWILNIKMIVNTSQIIRLKTVNHWIYVIKEKDK